MYIVITNPKAGNGKAKRLLEAIQKDELFTLKNCRSFQTEFAGHGKTLIESVLRTHHTPVTGIIVIGGDGTLHEAVNGLINYPDLPIGFIPSGSGNDFARGLGLRLQGVELFRKLVTCPNASRIRIGQVTCIHHNQKTKDYYFLNSLGTGLDSEIAFLSNDSHFRKQVKKWRISRLQYVIALFKTMKKFKHVEAEVDINGRRVKYKSFVLTTIANHPFFGKGMKIAPKADVNSSSFSVILIEPLAKWRIVVLFLSVFMGVHTKLRKVHELSGSSINIKSTVPILLQLDGQSYRCEECHVKKTDHALVILTD
ncbi:diacylglycerol kinase [Halobacillus andaensis]|uniref:Diacylglycerol kinase n=1 Tax=Halobacillus andaensis TaxID=1176239 RepID=A0A917ESM0_HALAA|nr:diacylglycerol kinase family protein [Halobacillus andaensis]MBP2002798.1 YegS/Rv2252/BmrU family lipid kinase [Halobacillus andaensis]GGF05790.1 diacylglycerol kinase [Halobacillus andaensis]